MPVDRAILEIAARQYGVVTSQQLAAVGFSRHAIYHRVKSGRLTRLHRGVYLTASLPAQLTFEMAAVLACGRAAVLSHHAAAALWGIRPAWHGEIDVTVASGQSHHRPGIRVHRAPLDPHDRTRRQGIPVTSPARTLVDLAPVLPSHRLDRAVEQAQVLRLVTARALAERLINRPGACAVRHALRPEPRLTKSDAEKLLLRLVRAAELPTPDANVDVHGHEVDLHWPGAALAVEVDGFETHGTRAAFERDRLRDARLQARGVRVMRITWRQLVHTPEAVLARLAAAMARG